MKSLQIRLRQSMFIIDGGPDAALPEGSGGPILPGREAILVAGRVKYDAATLLLIGPSISVPADLVEAYRGNLDTPLRKIRILSIEQDVLGEVEVAETSTNLTIFLTDLDEPDEIVVDIHPNSDTYSSINGY